jgi:hypothetical protein
MVRPMLPSNFDATEAAKWGKNKFGYPNIPIEKLKENIRKMMTLENVPTAAPEKKLSNKEILAKYGGTQTIQAGDNRPSGVYEKGKLVESDNRLPGVYDEKGKRISPDRPPVAPTSNWQQDITKRFPKIGKEGTPENQMFVYQYKLDQSIGKPFINPMILAEEANKIGASIFDDYSSRTAPTPQDIAEMEKAGTADMSPEFSPIEMRRSTLDAWQRGDLESTTPMKKPESFSRPIGSGTPSQRPTSTAPGASERVAYRRAIRMNPKSSEEDRRWARGIGGARNSSYGNYD